MSQTKNKNTIKRGSKRLGVRIEISKNIPKDLQAELTKIADEFFVELGKIKKP